jgi:spore maturation protein B
MNIFANQLSNCILLLFVAGIPLYGALKKIDVFAAFINGAKNGFATTMDIVPYLVAMIVAITMLRASGFFELLTHVLSPIFNIIGFPAELLPLALMRPFSGSAATAIMVELIHDNGGNSFIAKTAATLMGSTETTFYVVAVYFGAVGINKTRYAIHAGLLADLAGIIAAVSICKYLWKI